MVEVETLLLQAALGLLFALLLAMKALLAIELKQLIVLARVALFIPLMAAFLGLIRESEARRLLLSHCLEYGERIPRP